MPTQKTLRFVYKPLLFIVCLLPLAYLALCTYGSASGRKPDLGANPTEFLLHELGLWGLRFILVTLVVTPIRAIIGKPWPLAFRRMLGLFAFFYVLLHFSTWLLLDRELYFSGRAALPGILEDIGKRPFITIGFAAFLMLIPMAITSTNGMIRRLGALRWKKLHRLIYVIVLLGVWHFYWSVKADVSEPLIYAGIAAVLLGWRAWKARQRPVARTKTAAAR